MNWHIDPARRRELDVILTVLAGAFALASISLFLWRHIQPAQLVLVARASSERRVQFFIEPRGDYIPDYRYHPDRGRIPPGEAFAPVAFIFANEATPFFRLALGTQPGKIEIRTIRLETMFVGREWTAADIAQHLSAEGGVSGFTVEGDSLVITTNGNAASLVTSGDIAQELAGLQRIDDLALALLALAAPGALFVRTVLRCRATQNLAAQHHETAGAQGHSRQVFLAQSADAIAQSQRDVAPGTALPSKLAYVPGSRRVLIVLTLILLVWGMQRAGAVMLHAPLAGYANTGDFFRLLTCYGFQASPPIDPFSPQLRAAPNPMYVRAGEPVKDGCYLSSQLVLIELAMQLNRLWQRASIFDLRFLGIVSWIALCGAGVGITWLLARVALPLAFVSAASFALVLCDPFVTLFANTFFLEFSSLVFGILTIGLAVYVLGARDWCPDILLLLALSVFLLGMTRLQNQALPVLVAGWLGVVGWMQWKATPSRRRIVFGVGAVLFASALVLTMQVSQENRRGYMLSLQSVNRMDTYFGGLLPFMTAPRQAMQLLGLPRQCDGFIGKTWYDALPNRDECAEAARRLPAGAYVALMQYEPEFVLRLGSPVVDQSAAWIVDYVGQVAGGDFEVLPSLFPAPTWTIASLLRVLPRELYRTIVGWLLLSALLAVIVLLYAVVRPTPQKLRDVALVQLLLVSIFVYVFMTAFLGDGFLELAKHTFLSKPVFLIGGGVGAGLTALIMWYGVQSAVNKFPRQRVFMADKQE